MSGENRHDLVAEYHEARRQQGLPPFILDHIAEYETDPAKAHLWDASAFGGFEQTPTLMLSTIGRKSGNRTAPMPLIYGRDGDAFVVVGSNGGAPNHTNWYLNLAANPDVEVQVGKDRFSGTARTTTGDERQRLWEMMAKVYPPYLEYAQATDRQIPVVVLERKG